MKDFEQLLSKIKDEYQKSIPEKLNRIGTLIEKVRKCKNRESLLELKHEVHKIAGNAGTYGYPLVSELCKKKEFDLLHKVDLIEAGSFDPSWIKDLNEFLKEVQKCYEVVEEKGAPSVIADTSSMASLCYIVDSDKAFLESLEAKKANLPFPITTESDPKTAIKTLSTPTFTPHMVIAAQKFPTSSISGYDILKTSQRNASVILGLIMEEENLDVRIEGAERGVQYFFKRPFALQAFVNTLEEALRGKVYKGTKILTVDDDFTICAFIHLALQELGIENKAISDGNALFETLKTYKPQVLLLDIDLPGYDGLNLLRTLRSDSFYKKLTIVIVTSRNDPTTMEQIFDRGADEIIAKPLVKNILQKRIMNLLQRTSSSDLQERDPLTGMCSVSAWHAYIDQKLHTQTPQRTSYVVALCEIDLASELTQAIGEDKMHHLLIALGNTLNAIKPQPEIAAYLGSGRFGLVFYNFTKDEIASRIEHLLTKSLQKASLALSDVHIILNCGVAPLSLDSLSFASALEPVEKAVKAAKSDEKKSVKVVVFSQEVAQQGIVKEVCLIEDDQDVVKMLEYVFTSNGFTAHSFSSGKKALGYLLSLKESKLPIVLLDRLLPDGDGVEVLKKLKEQFPSVQVILLTMLSSEKDVIAGLQAGAIDYVTKPFNKSILLQKLANILKNK